MGQALKVDKYLTNELNAEVKTQKTQIAGLLENVADLEKSIGDLGEGVTGDVSAAINTAKAYTDEQVAAANSNANNKAAAALSDAKTYTDTSSASAVSTAKTYTDEQVAIAAKSSVRDITVNVTTGSWVSTTGTYKLYKDFTVTDLLATDTPVVALKPAGTAATDAEGTAYGLLLAFETMNGKLRIYCNTAPSTAINIILKSIPNRSYSA